METIFDPSPSALGDLTASIVVTPILDADDPTAPPILAVSFFNPDGSFTGARLSTEEAVELKRKLADILFALDLPTGPPSP